MVTLAEVAAAAGVSKATASRALSGAGYASEHARARVNAAAQQLGYRTRTPEDRRARIAVVLPALRHWYFDEAVEGVHDELLAAGADLLLFVAHPDGRHRRQVFERLRRGVDGVVFIGVAPVPEDIEPMLAGEVPVVGLGGGLPGMSRIIIDDESVGWLVTRHLIQLGHTRLLHFGGDARSQPTDFRVPSRRLAGFLRAMAGIGVGGVPVVGVRYSVESGYAAALQVLGNPAQRPTGIVAGCDEIAIGVLLAARELGVRVPEDLSVIGIDDHELASVMQLTTVRQDPRQHGQEAAALVLRALRGDAEDLPDLQMPHALVVRKTTAAPGTTR